MLRLTAHISGVVQKTGYRAQVVLLANAFELLGYVQNLPDGCVKVVAEGEEPDLERFLHALKINDALIDVWKIEAQYSAATGEFVGFEKMVARGETDQRLDKAADLLKDLIVVNKEVVKELKSTREGLGKEIRATREELGSQIKAAREELRDEIRATRNEVKRINENVEGIHESIKGVREDIRGVQEEVKGVREDVRCVRGELITTGIMLAEKIDCAKRELVGEIGGLRSELRGDLKERLIRMEADVVQIKTKIGM